MQGAEEEFPRFCRGCRAASHRIPPDFPGLALDAKAVLSSGNDLAML